MKPRIAIPQAHSDLEYSARNAPVYAHAVEQAGGTVVPIPLALSNVEIMRLVLTCDAVLLPGSRADVSPEKYGQPRHEKAHDSDPARDNADELLLQDAYNMHKPILAICFGTQILNVWRSGTLIQHLPTADRHTGNPALRHKVQIEQGSHLAGILFGDLIRLPETELSVNTSHHQAVAIPGDGLRVVARSTEDGVIEALEGTNPAHFVLALQWHPERLVDEEKPDYREPSRAIFSAFLKAARRHRDHPRTPTPDFEDINIAL